MKAKGMDNKEAWGQCDVYCRDKTYAKGTKVFSGSEIKAYCDKKIAQCKDSGGTFSWKNACASGIGANCRGKPDSTGCKPAAGACVDIWADSKCKRLSSVVHLSNSPRMACPTSPKHCIM